MSDTTSDPISVLHAHVRNVRVEKNPDVDAAVTQLRADQAELVKLRAERSKLKRDKNGLEVDENGCHTLPDGSCISSGPCLHTPIERSGPVEITEGIREAFGQPFKSAAYANANYSEIRDAGLSAAIAASGLPARVRALYASVEAFAEENARLHDEIRRRTQALTPLAEFGNHVITLAVSASEHLRTPMLRDLAQRVGVIDASFHDTEPTTAARALLEAST